MPPRLIPALALLWSAPLSAADFWVSKPWTIWSDQEIARLLVDSPWAKDVFIRFEGELVERYRSATVPPPPPASPGPGGVSAARGGSGPIGSMVGRREKPIPAGTTVGVRWESAKPLRQAIAATKKTAVAPEPDRYVIVIDRVPPYMESSDPAGLREALLAISQLTFDGGPPLRPVDATVTANDAGLVVRLEFPRQPDVAKARSVELHTRIGVSRVRYSFSLKTMMVAGRLEL